MTRAEYARHRGCSRMAVTKAVQTGRIPIGPDGRIDAAVADAAWLANTDPSKPSAATFPAGPAPAPGDGTVATTDLGDEATGASYDRVPVGITYADARTLREWNQALRLEQVRRQAAGQLAEVSELRDLLFTAVRAARDLLQGIEDRLTPLLVNQPEQEPIRQLLRREHLRVCEELAKGIPADPDAQSSEAAS